MDPRAKVKGSRDPLGLQPIWSRFGRSVVGNLTTVTTSVRNFHTLLLGLYFADRSIVSGEAAEEDRCDLFLKFEQLAGYSRVAHNGEDADATRILGITRIRSRLDEGGAMPISARQKHQILSAQKTYGLWGLYSVAARNSGLLEEAANVPTPLTRRFIEHHDLPRLTAAGKDGARRILRFLAEEESGFYPTGRHEDSARALAALLRPRLEAEEVDFYSRTLIRGVERDQTHGRQDRLWSLLRRLNSDGPFSWATELGQAELRKALGLARSEGDEDLAVRLKEILLLEPLLAASARAFAFLLRRHGVGTSEVVGELASRWGEQVHLRPDRLQSMAPGIDAGAGEEATAALLEMAAALHAGDYLRWLETALHLNTRVMRRRGGGPWVTVEGGRLTVRLREEGAPLPEAEALPLLWDNTYFINALKAAGSSLESGEAA